MSDQHIVADQQRRTVGIAGAFGIAMKHAAILHIGPLADDDAADIGAQHAIVPHRTVRPDLDIADDGATGGDEGAIVDLGRVAVDRNDGNAGARSHVCFSHIARAIE